ncbi:PepSY domain-containing protein [Thalassotalea ganghwensis]
MKKIIAVFVFLFGISSPNFETFQFGAVANAYQENNSKTKAVKSSQQAASVVKKKYGGKVLKVNKQKSDYKVKLLKPNGHVVSKKVDAKTGKIKKDN